MNLSHLEKIGLISKFFILLGPNIYDQNYQYLYKIIRYFHDS